MSKLTVDKDKSTHVDKTASYSNDRGYEDNMSKSTSKIFFPAISPSRDVNNFNQNQYSLPCNVNQSLTTREYDLQRPSTNSSRPFEGKIAVTPESKASQTLTSSERRNSMNLSFRYGINDIIVGKKTSDKLQRSRKRNRIHARKTRQRKKEQMLGLQGRADELKQEQILLMQKINEKSTASILVGLFSINDCHANNPNQTEDPKVEMLLRRAAKDIPDASKITELPALILPGQHNSKNVKGDVGGNEERRSEGIDYELLGKDRSKCTPEELDRIRRERNRMHAKRTRDRKRLFVEEMADMCKNLDEENSILRKHLRTLEKTNYADSASSHCETSSAQRKENYEYCKRKKFNTETKPEKKESSQNGVTYDQIRTLLKAANKFNKPSSPLFGMTDLASMAVPVALAVTVSANTSSAGISVSDDADDNSNQSHISSTKRRRLLGSRDSGILLAVPISITNTATSVGS